MTPIFPNLSIIVAVARDFAIGRQNDLLWHLSPDLKRFKSLTLEKHLIMGRKTFLSLPVRPLARRTSIVISDQPDEQFEGCLMASSVDHALALVKDQTECFIIGGASVYAQFLPIVGKLYITWVDAEYPDADVWFPRFSPTEWAEVENLPQPPDEASGLRYSYALYQRV